MIVATHQSLCTQTCPWLQLLLLVSLLACSCKPIYCGIVTVLSCMYVLVGQEIKLLTIPTEASHAHVCHFFMYIHVA